MGGGCGTVDSVELPIPEDPGLIPVIRNFNWTYLLLTFYRNDENEEAGNGPFKKHLTFTMPGNENQLCHEAFKLKEVNNDIGLIVNRLMYTAKAKKTFFIFARSCFWVGWSCCSAPCLGRPKQPLIDHCFLLKTRTFSYC